jgi:hypothetical protein
MSMYPVADERDFYQVGDSHANEPAPPAADPGSGPRPVRDDTRGMSVIPAGERGE